MSIAFSARECGGEEGIQSAFDLNDFFQRTFFLFGICTLGFYNNKYNRISIAPYGRNVRGAVYRFVIGWPYTHAPVKREEGEKGQ